VLHQIVQGLFGIFIASLVLLGEKIVIQIIARNVGVRLPPHYCL
jgi:hypothetical protein